MSALAACNASLIFMYQLDFVSPSPLIGGIWVVFVSHVLRYYCISPGCYPRHIMYVGFIILSFIWLMFMLACTLQFGPLFTGHTILLYFVSAGIGMPPPPPSAQVPSHKKRLVAPVSLVSSGSSPLMHQTPLHFSLSLPFWYLVIEFLQRTSVIRFAPNTRMLGGNLLHHFFGHLTYYY